MPAAPSGLDQRLDARATLEAARAKLFGAARAKPVTIDRYVIERQIGAGGMGEVYRAFDPQLARHVAIKLVHRDVGGREPDANLRLLREARALAQLDHPAIVPIHDVGVADERIWLAMELIDGETLRSWLLQPRAQREILGVLVRAGRGLAAAHARGILHRDFKPENVMVAPASSDRPTHVRVTDFGLAAWIDREQQLPSQPATLGDAPADLVTRTDAVLGTFGYLAPELLTGGMPSAASDQFAFCVSAYEALTGRRPFGGATPREIVEATVAGRIASSADDRVPRWIRALLRRGMAVDPAARFADIAELLDRLERDPVARRRRITAWGGSVIAVAAITAVAVPRGPTCVRDRARLAGAWDEPTRAAITEAFVATGAPWADDAVVGVSTALDDYAERWLDARLDACEATHVRGEQSSEALDLRTACLDSRLRGLAELTALLRVADGEIVRNAVRASRELARLEPCAEVAALRETLPAPDDPELAAAVVELDAQLARLRANATTGRYPDALAIGIAARDEAVRVGHRPTLAEARLELGLLQSRMGDLASAEQELRTAVWDGEASRHDRAAARAAAILVGVVGYGLARPERGVEWAEHSRALLDRHGGDDVVEGARLNNLAIIRDIGHDLAEARELYGRALELRRRALGEHDQAVAESLLNLGGVSLQLGELDAADREFREALAIYERVLGPEHPELAGALGNLAVVAYDRGEYREAAEAHRRALALLQSSAGVVHPEAIVLRSNLAHVLVALGETEDAVAEATRAVADADRTHGAEHYEAARGRRVLGEALLAHGEVVRAREVLTQASARLDAAGDPNAPEVRIELARAIARDGDVDAAIAMARAALAQVQARDADAAKDLARRELASSDDALDAALITELRRFL